MSRINYASIEDSIIGAICIDPSSIKSIRDKISYEAFNSRMCADIYRAACDCYDYGKYFDAVTLAHSSGKNVQNPESIERFICECMESTPGSANIRIHAELLAKKNDKVKFENVIREIMMSNDDPKEIAVALTDIGQTFLKNETIGRLKPISKILENMYNDDKRTSLRIDTGFPRLDGILKGMWGGNLIVIGARPGVGKSAFALDIARTAAMKGNKTFIYSLEMLGDEVAERLIARESDVALDKLIDNSMDKADRARINGASARIYQLPIYINDDPNVTIRRIRQEAFANKGVHLIIVDFLTLLKGERRLENRNLEIGQMCRELKNLASELEIPIIALAQLNRTTNDDERPTLRTLRDSGEIEQNANKVMFLWNEDADNNIVGVSVAKNRRGKRGEVKMQFVGNVMRYIEINQQGRV